MKGEEGREGEERREENGEVRATFKGALKRTWGRNCPGSNDTKNTAPPPT